MGEEETLLYVEQTDSPARKTQLHMERARRRQMTYFQKRRQQKKRQLFFNRIRALLRVVFAVLFLYGLWQFITAPFWLYKDTQFAVSNQQLLQAEELTPLVKAYRGKALYEINPQVLAEQVKQRFPIVDEVYVRRYLFPNRLAFSVLEKNPWADVYATVEAPQPYALLVQDARQQYQIIPIQHHAATLKRLAGAPRVKILLTPGQHFSASYLRQLDVLSYRLSTIPNLHFQYLDATQPTQLSARFEEVGLRIGCFNSEIEARLARFVPLVQKLPELKGKIDWVDLRWSHQMTVHKCKTPETPPAPETASMR